MYQSSHSHQPSLGFSVAGMSTASPLLSTSSSHQNSTSNSGPSSFGASSNTNNMYNSTTANTLGSSFSASKGYQSGYMMGASVSSGQPESEEPLPVVSTKAKLNKSMAYGDEDGGRGGRGTGRWGMESMFEGGGSGNRADDEDAPPMMSVNDIPNQLPSSSSRLAYSSLLTSSLGASALSTPHRPQSQPKHQPQHADPAYLIVFGYPVDKYGITLEFFLSLSSDYSQSSNASGSNGTTNAEAVYDVTNAFKIGYLNHGDAARALRKNGEIIRGGAAGGWMVGVKWAENQLALNPLIGVVAPTSSSTSMFGGTFSPSGGRDMDMDMSMEVDAPGNVGTPIRLAPATGVFRPAHSSTRTPAKAPAMAAAPGASDSPSKGVLGQVSDLIFGW